MKTISARGYAKLNLFLDIVGVLDNGYHLMNMITQTVGLFDIVTISKTNRTSIEFSCNIKQLIYNDNIVLKAANAFFDATGVQDRGISIYLEKKIPSGAGLGGGSADGAATLVILNELYNKGLSKEHLMEIGMDIGADIPCLILGGTCRVSGMGEKVKKIRNLENCYFVIVKPKNSVSTKSAFSLYDSYAGGHDIRDIHNIINVIEKGDISKIKGCLYNIFEDVIDIEQLEEIKDIFKKTKPISSLMTGSGSCIYGIYIDKDSAIISKQSFNIKGYQTFLVSPVSSGAIIV